MPPSSGEGRGKERDGASYHGHCAPALPFIVPGAFDPEISKRSDVLASP